MTEWQDIATAPEGKKLLTKIDDELGERNVQIMIRNGRLWWLEGRSMYVYYTPTHWAYPPEAKP